MPHVNFPAMQATERECEPGWPDQDIAKFVLLNPGAGWASQAVAGPNVMDMSHKELGRRLQDS